ncbi:cullin-associated NEDD8-dissociated protein 1, partial [Tanacetum coccineum]
HGGLAIRDCLLYEWINIGVVVNDTFEMTRKDKDYRYMATSDLLNELNKEGFKLDGDLELRLSSTVLQQLDDAAGDVSRLANKWVVMFSYYLQLVILKSLLQQNALFAYMEL